MIGSFVHQQTVEIVYVSLHEGNTKPPHDFNEDLLFHCHLLGQDDESAASIGAADTVMAKLVQTESWSEEILLWPSHC